MKTSEIVALIRHGNTYSAQDFGVVIIEKILKQLKNNSSLSGVKSSLFVNPRLQLVDPLFSNLPAAAFRRSHYFLDVLVFGR